MKSTNAYRILIIILTITFSSCIQEYALPDEIAEEYTEQLYIEGKILSGTESIVYVMKTIGVDGANMSSVTGAKVYILSKNGFKTENAVYSIDGAYIIQTDVLNEDDRYKLVVEYEGEIYESDFQYLESSLPIDEIGYTEDVEKGEVNIWVSSQGEKSNSPYFMWTFEEDYEYHALFDMRDQRAEDGYLLYSKSIYPEVTSTTNPYYYCWTHRNSHEIMIYSTDELSENRVKEHVIKKLTLDTPDLQELYCITVYQSNLSREAFEYYSQMKSNNEEMGSLFAPMPTEVYGNITCKTNPQIKVRGFVSASTTTMKRFFIHAADLKRKTNWVSGKEDGRPIYTDGLAAVLMSRLNRGYALIVHYPTEITDNDRSFSPSSINCLLTGGTKNKPVWWPNDHE